MGSVGWEGVGMFFNRVGVVRVVVYFFVFYKN